MPYTTVVPGTTITAAWANVNVRNQVVTPFATAAARTSAITSPVEGMLSYLSDSDRVEMYTGAAWVRVGPKGRIGGNRYNAGTSVAIAAGVSTSELVIAMSSGTVSLEANRSFEIRARVQVLTSVSGSILTMRFRETNISGAIRATAFETFAAASFFQTREFVGLYETSTADESKVFVITALVNSGTATFNSGDSNAAVYVDVVDVGPAGSITVI